MKRYVKELIILLVQLLIFYILPLTAGPADMMGLVVLLLISVFVLSIIIGVISKTNIKYIYSICISIIFIPSVFIYYNESALIYSIWFLVDSLIGLLIGIVINKIARRIFVME